MPTTFGTDDPLRRRGRARRRAGRRDVDVDVDVLELVVVLRGELVAVVEVPDLGLVVVVVGPSSGPVETISTIGASPAPPARRGSVPITRPAGTASDGSGRSVMAPTKPRVGSTGGPRARSLPARTRAWRCRARPPGSEHVGESLNTPHSAPPGGRSRSSSPSVPTGRSNSTPSSTSTRVNDSTSAPARDGGDALGVEAVPGVVGLGHRSPARG